VRHRILDRLDAMKVLLPDREDDPQLGQRFEREIRVQANLHHPNIAALHTALWVDGRLLMIIEFVDGVTLAQKLRNGPLSIRHGVEYISGVLAALGYAHAHGVIHRDVKPGNIMITTAGVVKLTDFGIARTVSETITRSGVAVGTLYYMSPEQIKTGQIDGRSDIYSVGITLYETLMGQRPIQGDSEHAIISAHLERLPVPPADFSPGFPAALSQIIMKSLAKNPSDRFQSAEEFRVALEPLLEQGASSAVSRPPATTTTLDPAILNRMEKCLAAAVGPIAKPLVARAARGVEDLAVLRGLLADQIPEDSARQKFLRCCDRDTGETPVPRVPTSTSFATHVMTNVGTREWSPEFLEKAQKELARHIGPLARVIVNKASRKVSTPAQLIELLGTEIAGDKQRAEFINTLRRSLG
jgi:serine/threonine protein kinase